MFESFSSMFDMSKTMFSGTMDIIVIKQKDDTYKSTSFNVRFGSFRASKTKEKLVTIKINNKETSLKMKLSSHGDAYFLFSEGDLIDNQENRDKNVLLKLKKKSEKEIQDKEYSKSSVKANTGNITRLLNEIKEEDDNSSIFCFKDQELKQNTPLKIKYVTNISKSESKTQNLNKNKAPIHEFAKKVQNIIKSKNESLGKHDNSNEIRVDDNIFIADNLDDSLSENRVRSISLPRIKSKLAVENFKEIEDEIILEKLKQNKLSDYTQSKFSNTYNTKTNKELRFRDFPNSAVSANLDINNIKIDSDTKISEYDEYNEEIDSITTENIREESDLNEICISQKVSCHSFSTRNSINTLKNVGFENSIKSGINSINSNCISEDILKYQNKNNKKDFNNQISSDFLLLHHNNSSNNSNSFSLKIQYSNKHYNCDNLNDIKYEQEDEDEDEEYKKGFYFSKSIIENIRREKKEDFKALIKLIKNIEFSLCLQEIYNNPKKCGEIFNQFKINKERFLSDFSNIISNKNLAVKIDNRIFTYKAGEHIILNKLLHNKDPNETVIKDLMILNNSGFFSIFRSKTQIPVLEVQNKHKKKTRKEDKHGSDELVDLSKSLGKRIVHPTSDMIKALNLNPGKNEIEFICQSRISGYKILKGDIYLWDHTDKIVISDVDGTITKSDVLGMVIPMIGKDWSQHGVTTLFTGIAENNYKILYLTARSICQAASTKRYLKSVKQGKYKLYLF